METNQVLSIAKIASVDYYLELATADYYLKGGEGEGLWFGEGARLLGLNGKVIADILKAIFRGFRPPPPGGAGNGAKLVQNADDENRTPGWDLTFSVPKSVSIFWVQVPNYLRPTVQLAIDQAWEIVCDYIGEELLWTRTGKGGKHFKRAHPVFAAFNHATNREAEPQKHVHALLLNVCVDDEGKTRTIHPYPILENTKFLGAMFRNELARILATNPELGLEIERDGDSFRLKRVPKKLERYYSSRSKQIEEELERINIAATSKAKQIACHTTKKEKGDIPPQKELLQGWKLDNRKRGFNTRNAREMRGKAKHREFSQKRFNRLAKRALKRTLADFEKSRRNFFREREFFTNLFFESCKENLPHQTLTDLGRLFLASQRGLLALTDLAGERLYSTEEILFEEQQLLENSWELHETTTFPIPEECIEEAIRIAEEAEGIELREEQTEAVRYACSNGGNIAFLSGIAGSGKTTALRTIAKAYELAGYEVLGMATTNRAKRLVQDEAQIESFTVAKGLADWTIPLSYQVYHYGKMLYHASKGWKTWQLKKPTPIKLTSKTLLIVDEASQIGTAAMLKLQKYVHEHGGKILYTGDDRQIQAIERGGPFHSNLGRFPKRELKHLGRQRHQWGKDMVQAFADGKAELALRILTDHKKIQAAKDADDLIEKAVEHWSNWGVANPQNAMICALENQQVHKANSLCQQLRKKMGHVRGHSISIWYERGVDQTYREEIYRGDRIFFRRKNERAGYDSGETGTVTKVLGPTATILLDRNDADGKPLSVKATVYEGKESPFSLGYAGTIYLAQGQSVEYVVAILSGELIDREHVYVAASRKKEDFILVALEEDLVGGAKNSPLTFRLKKTRMKGLAYDLVTCEPGRDLKFGVVEEWEEYHRQIKCRVENEKREQLHAEQMEKLKEDRKERFAKVQKIRKERNANRKVRAEKAIGGKLVARGLSRIDTVLYGLDYYGQQVVPNPFPGEKFCPAGTLAENIERELAIAAEKTLSEYEELLKIYFDYAMAAIKFLRIAPHFADEAARKQYHGDIEFICKHCEPEKNEELSGDDDEDEEVNEDDILHEQELLTPLLEKLLEAAYRRVPNPFTNTPRTITVEEFARIAEAEIKLSEERDTLQRFHLLGLLIEFTEDALQYLHEQNSETDPMGADENAIHTDKGSRTSRWGDDEQRRSHLADLVEKLQTYQQQLFAFKDVVLYAPLYFRIKTSPRLNEAISCVRRDENYQAGVVIKPDPMELVPPGEIDVAEEINDELKHHPREFKTLRDLPPTALFPNEHQEYIQPAWLLERLEKHVQYALTLETPSDVEIKQLAKIHAMSDHFVRGLKHKTSETIERIKKSVKYLELHPTISLKGASFNVDQYAIVETVLSKLVPFITSLPDDFEYYRPEQINALSAWDKYVKQAAHYVDRKIATPSTVDTSTPKLNINVDREANRYRETEQRKQQEREAQSKRILSDAEPKLTQFKAAIKLLQLSPDIRVFTENIVGSQWSGTFNQLYREMETAMLSKNIDRDSRGLMEYYYLPLLEQVICQLISKKWPDEPSRHEHHTDYLGECPDFLEVEKMARKIAEEQAIALENVRQKEQHPDREFGGMLYPEIYAAQTENGNYKSDNDIPISTNWYPQIYNTPISKESYPELYGYAPYFRKAVASRITKQKVTMRLIKEWTEQEGEKIVYWRRYKIETETIIDEQD